MKPVQAYEATEEEKQAVRSYALKHPGIRHRELAWRMVDEEVAFVSPSTVYRILKGGEPGLPLAAAAETEPGGRGEGVSVPTRFGRRTSCTCVSAIGRIT